MRTEQRSHKISDQPSSIPTARPGEVYDHSPPATAATNRQQLGLAPTLADNPAFSVGHLLVPQEILASDDQLLTRIQNLIGQ
ncbi:MAG: hypothetical protein AB7T15_08810, partial [Desulfuromonas sp.]